MSQPAQVAPPDLHFEAVPFQVGNQIMMRVTIADNFGMTFQLIFPPPASRAFGQYLIDQAIAAGNTLVKPPSVIDRASLLDDTFKA